MKIDLKVPIWSKSVFSAHGAPHVYEYHCHFVTPELVNRYSKPDDSAWICGDTRQMVQFQGQKWAGGPSPSLDSSWSSMKDTDTF